MKLKRLQWQFEVTLNNFIEMEDSNWCCYSRNTLLHIQLSGVHMYIIKYKIRRKKKNVYC